MGTKNPNHVSTYHLFRGLRGLISAVEIGVNFPEAPSTTAAHLAQIGFRRFRV